MAIDMIEDSDLGALSESRTLGGFIDDDRYANMLAGSRKKRAASRAAGTAQAWAIDPAQENDCEYLQARLVELQNTLQSELQKNPNKWERKHKVDPLISAEPMYKNAIARNKCQEKKEQAEEEKIKKETEEAIKRTAADTPNIPEVKVAQGSPVTKIIIIGVGVLVLAVVGIALFRKRN